MAPAKEVPPPPPHAAATSTRASPLRARGMRRSVMGSGCEWGCRIVAAGEQWSRAPELLRGPRACLVLPVSSLTRRDHHRLVVRPVHGHGIVAAARIRDGEGG